MTAWPAGCSRCIAFFHWQRYMILFPPCFAYSFGFFFKSMHVALMYVLQIHSSGAAELADAHHECEVTHRLLVSHYVDLLALPWVEALAAAPVAPIVSIAPVLSGTASGRGAPLTQGAAGGREGKESSTAARSLIRQCIKVRTLSCCLYLSEFCFCYCCCVCSFSYLTEPCSVVFVAGFEGVGIRVGRLVGHSGPPHGQTTRRRPSWRRTRGGGRGRGRGRGRHARLLVGGGSIAAHRGHGGHGPCREQGHRETLRQACRRVGARGA